MRTTIDLPPDLHALARELAHQQHKTLSQVITECVRRGLDIAPDGALTVSTSPSGFPIVSGGKPVTAEDVRSLEDEW